MYLRFSQRLMMQYFEFYENTPEAIDDGNFRNKSQDISSPDFRHEDRDPALIVEYLDHF